MKYYASAINKLLGIEVKFMSEQTIQSLGNVLRECRRIQNLTQDEVAEITGISKRHIANIEKGVANASFEIVTILAKKLNFSIDNIIFSEIISDKDIITNRISVKLMICTKEQKNFILNTIDSMIDEISKINS